MKKIIHINQHVIRSNRKTDAKEPVITIKDYKKNEYANSVLFLVGGVEIGTLKYNPNKPLSCGAEVWLEFDTNVVDVVPCME